jgi:TRAP-type mannitol/chloroaromatic compound transport system permease large subunit
MFGVQQMQACILKETAHKLNWALLYQSIYCSCKLSSTALVLYLGSNRFKSQAQLSLTGFLLYGNLSSQFP